MFVPYGCEFKRVSVDFSVHIPSHLRWTQQTYRTDSVERVTSLVELCPVAGNVAFYLKLQLLWRRLQLRYMASKCVIAVVSVCCHVYDAAYEHASKEKRRCCIECLEQKRLSVKGCNVLPASGLCTLLCMKLNFCIKLRLYFGKNFLLFVNFK
jgi:hypothetical protein